MEKPRIFHVGPQRLVLLRQDDSPGDGKSAVQQHHIRMWCLNLRRHIPGAITLTGQLNVRFIGQENAEDVTIQRVVFNHKHTYRIHPPTPDQASWIRRRVIVKPGSEWRTVYP
jgi:hypothetical protein